MHRYTPWYQDNNFKVDLSFEYFILSIYRCEQAGVGASAGRQMVQKTLWATADPVCLYMFRAFQKRLSLCTTPAPLDRYSHHLDLVVAMLNKERLCELCKASVSTIILTLKLSVSAENTALLLAMIVLNSIRYTELYRNWNICDYRNDVNIIFVYCLQIHYFLYTMTSKLTVFTCSWSYCKQFMHVNPKKKTIWGNVHYCSKVW